MSIHRSYVKDTNDHPIAAPCAIEGHCCYGRAELNCILRILSLINECKVKSLEEVRLELESIVKKHKKS